MLACVMAVASTAAPAPAAVAASVSCSGHSTAAALRTVRASSKSKYFARLCVNKELFVHGALYNDSELRIRACSEAAMLAVA
jgi:hypothetical protein